MIRVLAINLEAADKYHDLTLRLVTVALVSALLYITSNWGGDSVRRSWDSQLLRGVFSLSDSSRAWPTLGRASSLLRLAGLVRTAVRSAWQKMPGWLEGWCCSNSALAAKEAEPAIARLHLYLPPVFCESSL